jgi:hypothetical protein
MIFVPVLCTTPLLARYSPIPENVFPDETAVRYRRVERLYLGEL